MKKFIAIVAAVFFAALSFAYPIKVNAAGESYRIGINKFNECYSSSDKYLYVEYRGTKYYSKAVLFVIPPTANNYTTIDYSNGFIDIINTGTTLETSIKAYSATKDGNNYQGNISSSHATYKHINLNLNTGQVICYDSNNDVVNIIEGFGYPIPYSFYKYDYETRYDFYSYDFVDNELTYETNLEEPNPLDLSFTFSPAMNGNVSRTQSINGHNYTSDTLDITVTNNGQNAQWALFIVPTGESITIPALQWDNSKIWTGPSIFTYVKDEWCFDHFEPTGSFDVDTTQFMPSAIHFISSNDTKSYNINWSSMKLQANTNYDVVCYAALNDRGDNAVSFSNTYTYAEVYRSSFSMSSPATFIPDNTGDGGYSWDNDTDNSGLLSMRKATQDNFGNFYVNYPNNSYTNIKTNVNANQAFGNYFSFLNSFFSFFPPAWGQLIIIGLSALVVIIIIKAVRN